MKILITGATGFIGSWTARYFLSRGDEVIAPTRTGQYRRLEPLDNLKLVPGDLLDEKFVRGIFEARRPEVVIHMAADGVTSDQRADEALQKSNYKMTMALIDAAADSGVKRFIGLGSQAEYGVHNKRIDETASPAPGNFYGVYKLKAALDGMEKCRTKKMDFAWLRLFSTFGPRDNDGYLIPFVIKSFLKGEPPKLTDCYQVWDYLYVEDIPKLIARVIDCKERFNGVYNLCSGDAVTLREVVLIIRDLARARVKPEFGAIEHRPDGLMHLEGDNTKFHNTFGWADLTRIDQGLHKTVEWYKKEMEKETKDE